MKNDTIKNDVMYRHECSISKTTDPVEVIVFEICELDNTDVINYVIDHYAENLSNSLLEDLAIILDRIADYHTLDEEYVSDVISSMIAELNESWGITIKHVLWLASSKDVKIYCDSNSDIIDGYKTSPYILSDLGADGTLFAYEEKPICISSCELIDFAE